MWYCYNSLAFLHVFLVSYCWWGANVQCAQKHIFAFLFCFLFWLLFNHSLESWIKACEMDRGHDLKSHVLSMFEMIFFCHGYSFIAQLLTSLDTRHVLCNVCTYCILCPTSFEANFFFFFWFFNFNIVA